MDFTNLVTEDRLKIYYRIKRGKGPFFVFLHGLGGDLSVWQFLERPTLARGFSFLSLDLKSHGLSSRFQKPIEMAYFAQDVKGVLDKEKIRKVILVGHCFGGMAAQEFCLLNPDRVEKLILICSNCQLPQWGKAAACLLALMKKSRLGPKIGHRDFTEFKGSADFDLKRLFSDVYHVGLRSYLNIYQGIKDWNREKDLKRIKIPSTVIGGEKDKIFPPQAQRNLANNLAKSELMFLNTNHIAPINDPEGVKELLFKKGKFI